MNQGKWIGCLIAGACAINLGCGSSGVSTKELAPDAFYHAQPAGTVESRHVVADRPGQLEYDSVRMDLFNPKDNTMAQPRRAKGESVQAVSSAAQALAAPGATTAPSVLPPANPAMIVKAPSSGQYMTVGAVVVEVNGTPIYADKVLNTIAPVLSAEAKRRDAAAFEKYARQEISNQVNVLIRDELRFADAEKHLDANEQELADQITMQWRARQITESGGSIEQVRAKSAAEGISFDERLKEKKRENMVAIYYQKKIVPKVQVTADDMRRYYDKHLASDFSAAEQVQFRLLKISVKKAGDRAAALKQINDLAARVKKDEDFQALATQFNHDERLAKVGGLEQPIARGSYVNEKVEQAAFNLKQGQVSEVIDGGDAFYLVKLESKTTGRTQSFDDPAVQKSIEETLKREQMQPLIDKATQSLLSNAVIPYQPLLDPVVEMAMQRYPQWSKR